MDRRRGLSVTAIGPSNPMVPIAPAPAKHHLHRRGLSLDQGVNLRQQYAPVYGADHFDWSRWLDIGEQTIDDPFVSRPSTPARQVDPESFLLTPATTPCWKQARVTRNCKTAQSSPTKPQAIAPRGGFPIQKTKSLQNIAGNLNHSPQQQNPPPVFPNIGSLKGPEAFDQSFPHIGDDVFSDVTFSPESHGAYAICSPPSTTITSFASLPEIPKVPRLAPVARRPRKVPIAPAPAPAPAPPLLPATTTSSTSSDYSSPTKAALTPRAVSITDLKLDANIDASIEETGVTLNDIAAFIEGPDPKDNKWVCNYNGCMKRFGRKENIKSHVQTHLGDRQFKCNHCNKCFVRGHDLKRHAKIHTGVKPYPCECGNSFARHDALTRHKQRGMCTGAFLGVARRAERRGRPRKHRPELGERRDKAVKSRQRAKDARTPELSSPEPSSCASIGSPLSQSFDSSSTRETSLAKEFPQFDLDSISLPPDVFTFTPPASPSYSTGNVSSPARSYNATSVPPEDNLLCLSPTKRFLDDIPEEVPDLPSIGPGSPTPKKTERKTHSPAQILWPSAADSTLVEESSSSEFDDVFTNQATTSSPFSLDQLPPLDPPSTTALSECSSSQYDDELFLGHLNTHGSDLNNQYFTLSLSPPTEAFFD